VYGLALGGVLSLVLVYVINRQSFNWSLDLAVPGCSCGVLCVGARGRRRAHGDGQRARGGARRGGARRAGGLVSRGGRGPGAATCVRPLVAGPQARRLRRARIAAVLVSALALAATVAVTQAADADATPASAPTSAGMPAPAAAAEAAPAARGVAPRDAIPHPLRAERVPVGPAVAAVPGGRGRAPGVPHRVVVHHRLAADRRREPLGFQVTFFRTRPDVDERNPSAFTPRQLVIAHAAVSDPQIGKLLKAERIARAALGLAGASEGRTQAWIRDWRLESRGNAYYTRVEGEDFDYELTLERTQPPMLNGVDGYSRKGPIRAPRATTTACRSCASAARCDAAAARSA
jgi:hypothetical protein